MPQDLPIIAIAAGDPAGIGPEISLKAAVDPGVRAICRPVIVCEPAVLERHAKACRIQIELRALRNLSDAVWDRLVNVLPPPRDGAAEPIDLGRTSPAAGRASIAYCRAAVQAALAGDVDAVVGAPQNETSIAQAGIPFDGHPSFVARETGTSEDNVFMLLCFGGKRIAHATLHQSVRQAVEAITADRVGRVIRETDKALKLIGIAAPKIAVSGLNPHAGEGGLFGREEIEIIQPAIEAAARESLHVSGPFGADIMLHRTDVDAFVVMLHDQGHIAAKLLAPNATVAMIIGTPILFASVAHGSAHDIAGKGVADPAAMIAALRQLSGLKLARD